MNENYHIFADEVKRCLAVYAEYEKRDLSKTVWAPFNEVEAAYRAQQWLSFSQLMRGAGVSDLTGFRILDVGCGQGRLLRPMRGIGRILGPIFDILRYPSTHIAALLGPKS